MLHVYLYNTSSTKMQTMRRKMTLNKKTKEDPVCPNITYCHLACDSSGFKASSANVFLFALMTH